MKKVFAVVFCFIALAFLVLYGCSKSNPSSPAAPAATATNTAMPTSTVVASPNLSGTINVPAQANGKQFAVVVDDDANTANGYVNQFVGTVDSTSMAYAFDVGGASYYVYAYVDMNGSGLTGPGGTDYFGANGPLVTIPDTAVNFPCTSQLDITVTINVTMDSSVPGAQCFFGIFSGNDYADLMSPTAGSNGTCPSGSSFTFAFNVNPADTGTYYLLGFVDADMTCSGPDCFPTEGDYLRVYGASMTEWPASKNFTINGDVTVDLGLSPVVPNVSGTMTLPGSAGNNEYLIFVSTTALGPGIDPSFMITKTATAGSGSTINYSIFCPVPGPHYILGVVDMDGSGWDGSTGPVTEGDYAGLYGVSVPILNWFSSFPSAPNATLPGSNFNFTCDTAPDLQNPPVTPTPYPTPSSGNTGSISGNITLPSGQTGKNIMVVVDMDFNPGNGNELDQYSGTVSGSPHAYSISGLPVGTYYVYGATVVGGGAPAIGDSVGVYGATFPSFPGSRNVSVTNGGNTNANLTYVAATANFSGRVYLPSAVTGMRACGVVIDTDIDGGNGGQVGMYAGIVTTGQAYFDYSLFLALPGSYYVYAVVDEGAPYDMLTNGPKCGDFMGIYNFPLPMYFTPGGSNTNIDINATMGDMMFCP